MYEPRTYRAEMEKGRFGSYVVVEQETDLWIGVDPESFRRIGKKVLETETLKVVKELRRALFAYELTHRGFFSSLEPLPIDSLAPLFIQNMLSSAEKAGVGPMAGVAGAFSAWVGRYLKREFSLREIVVENGGDLFLDLSEPLIVAVYAGTSRLSGKLCITVSPQVMPLGVCTSSGTVGHSLSFGKSDAVMIAAKDATLADCYATAFANRVLSPESVEKVMEDIKKETEIVSAIVIIGDTAGIAGQLEVAASS